MGQDKIYGPKGSATTEKIGKSVKRLPPGGFWGGWKRREIFERLHGG
jgi:hypothetical protein